MKFLRKWVLPDFIVHRHEELEHPKGWGQSYFWYCFRCGKVYASAELFPQYDDDEENPAKPIWQGVSGLCLDCEPDPWHIQGTLECMAFVTWTVPLEIAHYQLQREVAFLDHPAHPYNKELLNA